MKSKLVPLSALRRAVLPLACSLSLLAVASQALAQESPPATQPPPAVTIAPQPEPAPHPDPAPATKPPTQQPSGGGQTSSPPAPSYTPPVSTSPAPTGPTPQQLAAQKQRTREKARRQAQERARKEAKRLQVLNEKSIQSGFSAFLDVLGSAPAVAAAAAPAPGPQTAAPRTVNAQSAAQTVAVGPFSPSSSSGSLSGAAPILLALLALAVVLLGLAALPPWTIRSQQIAGLLAHRRLEIGLVGTAILASAAIGLVIAVAAG